MEIKNNSQVYESSVPVTRCDVTHVLGGQWLEGQQEVPVAQSKALAAGWLTVADFREVP